MPTRPHAVLIICAFLPVIAAGPAHTDDTTSDPGVAFRSFEIDTGRTGMQTVLPGFFRGRSSAELAVIGVDGNGIPRLTLFAFESHRWSPVLESTLSAGVLFVDVVSDGDTDRLIVVMPERIYWFDPDSATEHDLLQITAPYNSGQYAGVPQIDLTRDLNCDGRDDIVIPDIDGFWISMQAEDGLFRTPVKLGPREPYADHPVGQLDFDDAGTDRSRTYADVGITPATAPLYLSRVHQLDYDDDGRCDLAFWNGDHLDVYRQDEHGQFVQPATALTVDVPFNSDGVYSRMFEYSGSNVMSAVFGFGEKSEQTVMHSFRDLNADDTADLVTQTLNGRSLTKQRGEYAVHHGSSGAAGVTFSRQPATSIRTPGKASGMEPWGYTSRWFEDIDGDGQCDLVVKNVTVGIGGMTRALVGHSVPINILAYRNDNGLFADNPAAKIKIRRFDMFDNVFFPPVLLGDVNGDGHPDLVVGNSPNQLSVYAGHAGPRLFLSRPVTFAVNLPYDERRTRLVDLNRDNRKDILVFLPSTERMNRITLLVAE